MAVAVLCVNACARKAAKSASEEAECRPIRRADLERRRPPAWRSAWHPTNVGDWDVNAEVVVLSVQRGADHCVEVVDPAGAPGPAVEDPIIAIRLSSDGQTLWVNNQLHEALGASVFVLVEHQGSHQVPAIVVAPHSVLELGFEHAVERASLSNFWFSLSSTATAGPHAKP
jgi:hypothetical protein